jgi:hypothetical protein
MAGLDSEEPWPILSLGDLLEAPWESDPNAWFTGADDSSGMDLPDILPGLDLMSKIDDDDDLVNWLQGDANGVVQTPETKVSSETVSHENQVKVDTVVNEVEGVVLEVPDVALEVDLYASDASLGLEGDSPEGGQGSAPMDKVMGSAPNVRDQGVLPVVIPGWNMPNEPEPLPAPTSGVWSNAFDLACEFIRDGSTSAVSGDHSYAHAQAAPSGEYAWRPARSVAAESPASPDMEVGVDAYSDTSDYNADIPSYRPVVSPITDVPSPRTPPSPPRLLGPSAAQRYWSNLQSRPSGEKGFQPQRIAMVRPRPRRRTPAHRRISDQRFFRIITPAPVVRSQHIISRVTSPNGHVAEETMNERFDMARDYATQTVFPMQANFVRTVSTQTLIPLFADVQTGMENGDLPRQVIVIRVGGMVRHGPAVGGLPMSSAVSVPASSTVTSGSDVTGGQESGQDDGSNGTPLQDE